jgi:uncharacterized protein YigE (DUF2233 family)
MASHRPLRYLLKVLLCGFFTLGMPPSYSVELVDYSFHNQRISTCKIDLRRDAIRMFWKDDNKVVLGRFSRLQALLRTRGEDIVCATNAGIYEEDFRPLGLYIENGITRRKLNLRKNAYGNFYLQPNGIFLIRDRQAQIVDTDRFAAAQDALLPGVLFATQSGPMMIQNGKINPMFSAASENRLIRNAVCITSPQNVVLAISREPINFYEFAAFLRDKIACTDALFLDGNISRMYPEDSAEFGPDFGVLIAVTQKLK